MRLEHTMKHKETNDQAIDFNKAKIVSTYNDLSNNISENNDIVSRLTRRLQTTLDCEDIIEMFAGEVKTLVDFDQMSHSASNQDTIKIGDKSGAHSCQYNLSMDETDLGSLTFSRKQRFIEEELCIIEKLASTLVFPLRNAKLYQQALNNALANAKFKAKKMVNHLDISLAEVIAVQEMNVEKSYFYDEADKLKNYAHNEQQSDERVVNAQVKVIFAIKPR